MSDKILCLADLHIYFKNSKELTLVKEIIKKEQPTYVLIAGDVFESDIQFNPYKELATLGLPVICCFGNHEFSFKSIEDVKDNYAKLYDPGKYDVHYLDIIGHKEILFNDEKLNIVGNALWYDGSFKDIPSQDDAIIPEWLDCTIKNFDYKVENRKCINQIKVNYEKNIKNLLLTHCAPQRELNLFSLEAPSRFNMYSGCNLLEELRREGKCYFDWVICGHTHRYTTMSYHDQRCINIGNDYLRNEDDIKYFTIDEI